MLTRWLFLTEAERFELSVLAATSTPDYKSGPFVRSGTLPLKAPKGAFDFRFTSAVAAPPSSHPRVDEFASSYSLARANWNEVGSLFFRC